MRDAGRKNLSHYIILAVIGIAVIVYLMPIYWIVATIPEGTGRHGDKSTQVSVSDNVRQLSKIDAD